VRALRWSAPAACALALAGAGSAAAHTELVSTRPAEGATLGAVPARVVATYSAPLAAAGPSGAEVGGRDIFGPARLDPADARRLVVPLGAGAGPGRYRVRWSATAADGHELTGELTFTVRARPLAEQLRELAAVLGRAAAALVAGLPA